MHDLGRLLISLGLVLLIIGVVIVFLSRAGVPLGRLPGDVAYRGRGFSIYFPLATSIILSVVLSLIFYLLSRFRR